MNTRTVTLDPERSTSAVDGAFLRRVMGRFASGVTIVTAARHRRDDAVHGMTVNSFLSVSLDPPLVLVSVARSSRMASLLSEVGRYGVSILGVEQEEHSRHFAGRRSSNVRPRFDWHEDIPLLKGGLAHVGCEVVDEHGAGDHLLFIGHVRYLAQQQGQPLVFATGTYRSLYEVHSEDVFTH